MLFEPPTSNYKTGLAHLAWLDGRQSNSMLPFHVERLRPREHLKRIARAAAECGALVDR